MLYIDTLPNPSGVYAAPLSNFSKNLIAFPDKFLSEFYKPGKLAAGFVDIEHDGEKVTSCVWNEKAYQEWLSTQPDPLDTLREQKEAEISAACNAAIVAGMDVETSQGTEHFSLQETDQINLTTAYNAILSGAWSYPYHSDGNLCRMFTGEEIKKVSEASIQHKLYHTTLCNHLLTWVRRSETELEIESITYTEEGLPEDLKSNMSQILMAAQNV